MKRKISYLFLLYNFPMTTFRSTYTLNHIVGS